MLPCEFLHDPESLLLKLRVTNEICDVDSSISGVGLESGNGLLLVEYQVRRTESKLLPEYASEVVNE